MNLYLVALTPLLLALTAVIVVLPIGLHYADKERAERRNAREATASWYPITAVHSSEFAEFAASFRESLRQAAAEKLTQPQQSQTQPRPFGRIIGKIAAAGQ